MKVLWLASWFPNRTSPYNGDFIERHAMAVAPLLEQLDIICVVKDDAMPPGSEQIVKSSKDNVTTYIAYYGPSRQGLPEKVYSFAKYFSLQKRIFKEIYAAGSLPGIVHVHVPMKAGLFACYLKKKFKLPFVVTEHWAAYTKNARPSVYDMGFLFLKLNNYIIRNASCLLPVSADLGNTITRDFVNIPFTVVPNVVNTDIFYYADERKKNDVITLLHISGMGYQKNIPGLFEALHIWKQQGGVFELNCYGNTGEEWIPLVEKYGLQHQIKFHGEVPQKILADVMRRSDALVLYSLYETFGCVIAEANACGLPVIVSDIPVFHELVKEGVNGKLVKSEDPDALANALINFSHDKYRFDRSVIACEAAQRFNYKKTGAQIMGIYEDIIRSGG